MINEVLEETKDRMKKSEESFEKEMAKVRTGRASQAILDGVRVDYYGTQTPLTQMATVSIPESRLITVKPWDVSVINEVEKAILKADLGLTPNSDGKIVRVSIPPLTEDRRKELVKMVKKISEAAKISVRNHRRKINDDLKSAKNDKLISEDDMFKSQEEVQKITDEYVKKCDELGEKKEKEIMDF